jgi:hypothetical protein
MRKMACLLGIVAVIASASAASFTTGNLVVVRVGNGSATLNNAATPTFLDEYTSGGTLVQSIPMPTAASGLNRQFTNAGTSTSEGFIARSVDGLYLTLGGYDAAVGTASVAGTTSAAVNRVLARVDLLGNIDTTTALTHAFSGGNIRSVVTTDGSNLWATGSNSSAQYATFGGTTATQLATSPTNLRVGNIFAGQLYTSSATGTYQGVSMIGTGLPTTSGQTITLLSGFPTAAGPSAYDFYFADSSTLYVADDRTVANGGGLQKWTLSGSTWGLAYTLNSGLTAGLRGLTGTPDGLGNIILYATSGDGKLVAVTDTGAASAFATLATAGTNTAFRGVEFTPLPEPASLLLVAVGALLLRRR